MNGATLIQGILIYGILGWKSFQLSRAGRDLPLRCVVAVFVCAGAAYPIGIAYSLHALPANAWWLMFAHPSLLLGCVCSLDLFFLFSMLPPSRARRLAVIRAVVLGGLVAGMAAAASTVDAYTGMSGQTSRGTDVMYLLFNAGMAGFLIDSQVWARYGIQQADRTGARGLRLASWGLGLMVAGLLPLTADVAARVFGATVPPVYGRIGQLLVLPGILLFLTGISYPTATDRLRAIRSWRRHRRTYRDLGPLWRALHEVFPEGTLPTRLPSSRWLEAVTPWNARRRAVRRQLECRDGLVRISPYIRPSTGENDVDLAERILDTLRTVDPASLRPGKAVPVAIPEHQAADTDIVADAAELVRLSRTLQAARACNVLPSAIGWPRRGNMKVLIAGGGIAGPAAAIALDKAGIASEIYEAYPAGASDDTGAFLTLTANGQDALDAIDVGDQVRSLSFPTERLRLFDASGTKVMDASPGSGRPSSRTIGRAALSHVLRGIAVTRRIPVLYGKRLVSASPDSSGGVVAVFDDGSNARGDLLIGADGVHSPVRAMIDASAPSPRYTGLVIACGYAPGHLEAADGYSMYYGSRAFFGCTPGPDDQTWWFARIPADEVTAARLATNPDADLIAQSYDGDATPAADLIRASARWPLTVTPARHIAHLPVWSRDRMIVIGDAAHPVSPMTTQGASLAIEDAAVMAKCLRDVSPIPDALRVFEELRRERVEEIARSGASGENPAPPAPGPRTGPRVSPVLDHHVDWDKPVNNI